MRLSSVVRVDRHRAVAASSILLTLLIYLSLSRWIPWQTETPLGTYGPNDISKSSTGVQTTSTPSTTASLGSPSRDVRCAPRFDLEYLRIFTKATTNYCERDSPASLHCFSHRIKDDKTDSFCIGYPGTYLPEQQRFQLDCRLRDWTDDDVSDNIPTLDSFPVYWYNTGPIVIFLSYITFHEPTEPMTTHPKTTWLENESPIYILVSREEACSNLWHAMMEVMSVSLTLDILRMAKIPVKNTPFFSESDVRNTQIVILDDYDEGPAYGLWKMFGNRPVLRLGNLSHSPSHESRMIVPLPGSSNPFWQAEWVDYRCGESEILRTFSDRVLKFYDISQRSSRPERRLRLTMIDRQQQRRLLDKQRLFEKLKSTYPSIDMELIDFATLPLREQLEFVHGTDILVGVHGAGLTHGIFLPPNSTLVEIQPPRLNHKGFKLVAESLGHQYITADGEYHETEDNTGDWHQDDVYMPEKSFLELMELATTSTVS